MIESSSQSTRRTTSPAASRLASASAAEIVPPLPLVTRAVQLEGAFESAAPGREREGAFVGGAVVHRLAMGDDHVLEGQIEQRAQRRQHPLFVPRRCPDA